MLNTKELLTLQDYLKDSMFMTHTQVRKIDRNNIALLGLSDSRYKL